MKEVAIITMAGIMVGLIGTFAAAAGEPVAIARGTAQIDGRLDEFLAAGAQVIKLDVSNIADAREVDDNADNSAAVYAMYDSKYFYIGALVSDDAVEMNKQGGEIWNSDAVEFWLADKQFGIAVSAEDNRAFVQDWKGVGAYSDAAVVRTSDGYAVEARVSIAELSNSGVGIGVGKKTPFAVGTDDADEEGGNRVGQLYFPVGWSWGDVGTYAIAVFE